MASVEKLSMAGNSFSGTMDDLTEYPEFWIETQEEFRKVLVSGFLSIADA